jgi:hypothetical protein
MITPPLLAGEILCPPTLEINATVKAPPNWTSFDTADNNGHKFDFAEFSDGPPQSWALLLPSKQADLKQGRVLTFDFRGIPQPWLICSYGGTSLTLSQKLAAATKLRKVTLGKSTNFSTAKKIECF